MASRDLRGSQRTSARGLLGGLKGILEGLRDISGDPREYVEVHECFRGYLRVLGGRRAVQLVLGDFNKFHRVLGRFQGYVWRLILLNRLEIPGISLRYL